MKSLTILSDQELVQMYITGNAAALSELVNRYKTKLHTSIYLLVKDKYLAEDIFQDTFIKIIDTLTTGKYNEEGKFLSWAMRIAHNKCVDHFRKVKRMPAIKTSDDRDIFETLDSYEPGIETRTIQSERQGSVRQMIGLLPEEQREVLVLRHYADLSFKEIAKLMNCSINTALGRMRYGLLNLRKMITENEMALLGKYREGL